MSNKDDFYLYNLYVRYKEIPFKQSESILAFKDLISLTEGYEHFMSCHKDNIEVTSRQFIVAHNAVKFLYENDYAKAFSEVVDFFQNYGSFYHNLSFNEYAVLSLVLDVFKEQIKKGN